MPDIYHLILHEHVFNPPLYIVRNPKNSICFNQLFPTSDNMERRETEVREVVWIRYRSKENDKMQKYEDNRLRLCLSQPYQPLTRRGPALPAYSQRRVDQSILSPIHTTMDLTLLTYDLSTGNGRLILSHSSSVTSFRSWASFSLLP